MLDQTAAGSVSDGEIRSVAGSAGIEPAGGRTGANLPATGEDMVVELGRQAKFVGVTLAPFLDQGRKHLLGSGLPAELRQDVEQVKLGKIAPG